LRDAFVQLGHAEAIVQRSDANTFVIRTRPLLQATANEQGDLGQSERQQIEQALTGRFGALQILNLDQVSPLIAEEIVRYAILAGHAGALFFLLYRGGASSKASPPGR